MGHSQLGTLNMQTDTSLAIESKIMKKWEFDSIPQAVGCISSWFSGTLFEKVCFKEHLDSTVGIFLHSTWKYKYVPLACFQYL